MHAAVSATFFQNVAQLEIISASPKHPQSETGSAMAIHAVRGSMTHITPSANIDTHLRKQPKSMNTPMQNSARKSMKANAMVTPSPTSMFMAAR